MFQLSNKKNHKISKLILLLIFIFLLFGVSIGQAESKVIIYNLNKEPTINDYKIVTNLFSGTKALVDENNSFVVRTTSSKDNLGFLVDSVTNEKRFVWTMTPNGAVEKIRAMYYSLREYDYKIYDSYTYYDFRGNLIKINDERMHKIEYLINNYMIYVVWNDTEPEMKAYDIDRKEIITIGNYNYLYVVDDKIILSKDTYGLFYDLGSYQVNDMTYGGYITKGNNKMLVCDMSFEKIIAFDNYSYMNKVKFNDKTYYKIYVKYEREQNDHEEPMMVNFLDENLNLVLDMPVYEFMLGNGIDKKETNSISNQPDNDIVESKESVYVLKDLVKEYEYDFSKREIINIIKGKKLTDAQLAIYLTSEELGRYTFNNGVIRLLKNFDGKYRLYDKFYNLIFEKEIDDPSNGIKCHRADTLDTAMFDAWIKDPGLKKVTLVFDNSYKCTILENIFNGKNIKSANNAFYYFAEEKKVNTKKGELSKTRKVDECVDNKIYNLKTDKTVELKSAKRYRDINVIFVGKKFYISTVYLDAYGTGPGDLFDIDGNVMFENFRECLFEKKVEQTGEEFYKIRLENEKLICDSNLNVVCKFTKDYEYFVPMVNGDKIMYRVRLYDYGGTSNKNWTTYYTLLDSNFNIVTTDFDKPSGRISSINQVGDYIKVNYSNGNTANFNFDGKEVEDTKLNSEEDENEKVEKNKVVELNIGNKKYHLTYTNIKNETLEQGTLLKNFFAIYDDNNQFICNCYNLYAFEDESFIALEKDKIVYYDNKLNRKEVIKGDYIISNCISTDFVYAVANTSKLYNCFMNDKKGYYVLRENKNNDRFILIDNGFSVLLNDYKGLSECNDRYVNYLKGFKYGLYDIDKKQIVSEWTIFDNFDEDEEDYEYYSDY